MILWFKPEFNNFLSYCWCGDDGLSKLNGPLLQEHTHKQAKIKK